MSSTRKNFIRDIVDHDREGGLKQVVTRFPPEPNGYLHIGHSKAICVDFGLARDYQGRCHLRMDDTNPTKEDIAFVDSIKRDIQWLGFDWGEHLYFASDYFDRLYEFALQLIRDGKAYVCSLSEGEIREYRGSLREAGKPSPYRDRSVEENLDLIERMKQGEFADGEHVLRAKIDMSASNMKMRDPLMYRIRHAHHYRTGDKWHIYPMYDFAHGLSDAIEGVTHSICTLEFENNRELYDWFVDNVDTGASPNPKQIEFARLALDYTVMSKRKLLRLVEEGHVSGWDDPRMPTLAAYRRRGYTPESIRNFCDQIGVAKANSTVDIGKLEFAIRDNLNGIAPRVMAVLEPIKVVLEDYEEGKEESLCAPYFPPDIGKEGERELPFSRELYIDREDFSEDPPKGFRRLTVGGEVRLRHAYVIKCERVVKDESGKIVELRCTHDAATLNKAPEGRKVSGVIHWVSAPHAVPAEVRVYDRLFAHPRPDSGDDFVPFLNQDSLHRLTGAMVEPSIGNDQSDTRYQFERQGYYWRDPVDSKPDALVFNRIVPLRDSWAKRAEEPAPEPVAQKKSKSKTRPQKKSRAEVREIAREKDPELAARFGTLQSEHGLSEEEADVLSGERGLSDFFLAALAKSEHKELLVKWTMGELLREAKDTPVSQLKFSPEHFSELVALVAKDTLTAAQGKTVLATMAKDGTAPSEIVAGGGFERLDSGALSELVAQVIGDNGDKVEAYRGGKKGLMGFFVGQVMAKSGGQADAKEVSSLLRAKLDA